VLCGLVDFIDPKTVKLHGRLVSAMSTRCPLAPYQRTTRAAHSGVTMAPHRNILRVDA
jgi:hypothetical protein